MDDDNERHQSTMTPDSSMCLTQGPNIAHGVQSRMATLQMNPRCRLLKIWTKQPIGRFGGDGRRSWGFRCINCCWIFEISMLIAIWPFSSLPLDVPASATSHLNTFSTPPTPSISPEPLHPTPSKSCPQLQQRKMMTAQQAPNAPACHTSDNATQPRIRQHNTAAQRTSMGAVASTVQS
ncbi:hypothetical protein BU15DRAFT_60510 [Melanogaster broomeanus]|nr:hypothetical protein BU15DRAFT_60510 [Melanogaster broomeanus]